MPHSISGAPVLQNTQTRGSPAGPGIPGLDGGTNLSTDYLRELIARYAGRRGVLLVALQDIQDHAGYIPQEAIEPLARVLGIPEGEVLAVISFYKDLRTIPPGRHRLCVCRGDSCAALGSHRIAEAVQDHLDISPGGTSADGQVTYDTVYCLGNCALSPSISIDGEVQGRTTPEQVVSRLKGLPHD